MTKIPILSNIVTNLSKSCTSPLPMIPSTSQGGLSRCWLDSMIIAQVGLRLATIIDHSKMCSFIHTAQCTDVESFKGACNWHADCRNVQYRADVLLYRADCRQPCMGLCGVTGCWCQRCGSSGPWWWWGCGNELRCILLMAFWMHRDTMMRSWGPLLCHLSTTITSCCSMMMHGPMLPGSVHNSWKLKTSQFLHGQHTHRTYHPLSVFRMLWIGVFDSELQFLPISSNFTQPLKRSGPTFYRPQSTTWSTLCEGDVLHCVRQMVVTPDTDWCKIGLLCTQKMF